MFILGFGEPLGGRGRDTQMSRTHRVWARVHRFIRKGKAKTQRPPPKSRASKVP